MPYCVSCGSEVEEIDSVCERCASLAKPPSRAEKETQRVVITGVKLPWGDVFDLMVKVAILIIPVAIILAVLILIALALLPLISL